MQEPHKAEIRKGLLVAAVLAVIGSNKMYASEILGALKTTEFSTQEGTLYPLLGKLKREGYLLHEWIESPSGPPRKYYSLSPEGVVYKSDLLAYLEYVKNEIGTLGGTK